MARGDNKAITWVYEEYGPVLFTVCLRYGGSREEAEDLFQEGFLHILDKAGSYKGDSALRSWMYRVMCNYCISALRKQNNKIKFNNLSDDEFLMADEEEPEVESKINQETLIELIQQLPAGYRLVLNMYALENKSHTEIAAELGMSETTSRTQLFKARRMLRKKMEELK
ncbi:MAG: sigma-70 family RNA polymerase sigma factor [Bacteroidetes bacterium]|nr:sigma-70 family RNA polymerase sigma factor [Bacteroidota bacterium]